MSDEGRIIIGQDGSISVPGAGPIDCVFTIKLIEAIFTLPVKDDVSLTKSVAPSVASILRRLTPTSRRSFDSIVKLDKSLGRTFEEIKSKLAFDPKDIVEELFVDCNPVTVVVFTKDGQRFVSSTPSNYDVLLTFSEFEAKYGRTVSEHVHHVALNRIEALQRATLLIDSPMAIEYSLDVVTENMAMATIGVKVWSEDQVHAFAKRQKFEIMTATPPISSFTNPQD